MPRASLEGGLHSIGRCRLCGRPMIHHRLYGYQCSSREHQSILFRMYESNRFDEKKVEVEISNWRKRHGY